MSMQKFFALPSNQHTTKERGNQCINGTDWMTTERKAVYTFQTSMTLHFASLYLIKLSTTPKVFGFVTSANQRDWGQFDWDTITTIAWVTSTEMMCHAHSHGVRVIGASPPIILTANKTSRGELLIFEPEVPIVVVKTDAAK